MFVGAAMGMAVANLPGLSLVPAIGMGLAATCAAVLQLPLTSVLLASVFLQSDSLELMPLLIVAVVVSYVTIARLPEPSTVRLPRRSPLTT
jgi:H+/Cl- antiporter ClcA